MPQHDHGSSVSEGYDLIGNVSQHEELELSNAPVVMRGPFPLWLLFGAFMIIVIVLGGSSRPDSIQSALLRPLSALLLIPITSCLRHDDLRRGKAPLIFLSLMTGWMILQLIPLPPAAWQTLPGRQVVMNLDRLAGLDGLWRPISFTPFRGMNSVFGMVVPITAVLMALALKVHERLLMLGIALIGLANALVGLLQVTGGIDSPFYLYALTNRGAPAGIFANENHSAVLSAVVLLAITRLALSANKFNDPRWVRFSFAPIFFIILLSVLVTGSRAGLLATFLSLGTAALMTWLDFRTRQSVLSESKPRKWRFSGATFPLLGFVGAIALAVMTFLWFERTPAFSDLVERNSFEDLRWSLWPVLQQIMVDHWAVGTGFGSFDAIYHAYEPTELLLPAYVNHAHNDWAQLVIEAGSPGILLLTASLFWIAMAIRQVSTKPDHNALETVFWLATFMIVSAASIVDYPLRTPIFQVVLAWLAVCLALEKERKFSLR